MQPLSLGIALRYSGEQFVSHREIDKPVMENLLSTTKEEQTEQFKDLFSATGALVLRYNLGHRQRTALIQRTTMRDQDYQHNSVVTVANGGDATVFPGTSTQNKTFQDTMKLFQISHATLGKSKVINERGQPLKEVNKEGLSGELYLWDIIHMTVWNAGISLPSALEQQGFCYVMCPEDIDLDKYNNILRELESKKFKADNNGNIILHTSQQELKKCSFKEIEIIPDPDSPYPSRLSISFKADKTGKKYPSGFIINQNGVLVNGGYADNLLKVMRMAKGGFHKLTRTEQDILTSGSSFEDKEPGQELTTQSRIFNALIPIFSELEKNTGFSAVKAMKSNIALAVKRLHQKIESSPELLEDFLVGDILTEMVQPLKTSQSEDQRSGLPMRLNNDFRATHNTSKAIAYAFNIKDKNNQAVFQANGEDRFIVSPDLIDVQMNGTLKKPNLERSKHIAAILSTAILVSEQLIVETLTKNITQDINSGLPVLKDILGSDEAEQLLVLAHEIEEEKLGRQFEESDELIQFVRDRLDTGKIITFIDKLQTQKDVSSDKATLDAISRLKSIGNTLQGFSATSAKQEESQGINAGLSMVCDKIMRKDFINSRLTA